ncbi:hemicentin-1-like, partial [Centruroides sculpturatus]|uniref:hemicentin-1-like n=1 Tax=Centruroides sculpturatus TaxID=218467 RepID=UPI000C6E53A6
FIFSLASIRILQPLPATTIVDLGSKLTLSCNVSGIPNPQFSWFKDGQKLASELKRRIRELENGILVFTTLEKLDEGNYTCHAENDFDALNLSTRVIIQTPPDKLVDVSVHPTTIVATIRWRVSDDGGYPITHFTLMYRPLHSNERIAAWHIPFPILISPIARQFLVYNLQPGMDYIFRLWANNKLGPGEATVVQASTTNTLESPDVIRHMLANSDEFSSAVWMVAISVVMGTVLVLSCLSCILIYKESRNGIAEGPEVTARVIANPGFEINLEESYLLERADYNDNVERPIRLNNNTVLLPSSV